MAIYSLEHAYVGRSTHAAGTAGAHLRYVTRPGAATAILGEGMGDNPAAWMDAQESYLRSNARVVDKLRIALPAELTDAQRVELVRDFASSVAAPGSGERRAPWLAAIHRPSAEGDRRNTHVHVVIHDRDQGDGKRVAMLSDKGRLQRLREEWAVTCNAHLERAGLAVRIDHRSLADQGVTDRPAGIHLGATVTAMVRNGAEVPTDNDAYARYPDRLAGSRVDEHARREDLRRDAAAAAAAKVAEAERQARADAAAALKAAEEAEAHRRNEARRIADEQAREVARLARRKAEAAEASRQAQDAARRPVETVRAPNVPVPPPPVQKAAPRASVAMVDPMAAAAAWRASQQAAAARRNPKGPIPPPTSSTQPQVYKTQPVEGKADRPAFSPAPTSPEPSRASPATPKPPREAARTPLAPVADRRAPSPTPTSPEPPRASVAPLKPQVAIQPEIKNAEVDPRIGNSPKRQAWLAKTIDRLRKLPLADRRADFDGKILPGWARMMPPAEAAPTWTEITDIWRWCAAHSAEAKAWIASCLGTGAPGHGKAPTQRGD